MAPRNQIDWEAIEREFRAGQLSVREIARQHEVSDTAIRKRAKAYNWDRDLTERVKEKVRNALVRGEVRADHTRDEEIIEAAASRALAVVEIHRTQAATLRNLLSTLMSEVEVNGDEMKTKEKSEICRNIGQTLDRLVTIERTAFSIDDAEKNTNKCLVEID